MRNAYLATTTFYIGTVYVVVGLHTELKNKGVTIILLHTIACVQTGAL